MLIVHLFVSYAHVNLYHFFSSSWCRGLAAASACVSAWTFLFTFFLTGDMGYFICFIGHRSFTQGNRQSEKVTTLTAAEEEETTTEASHWNGQ